jgi:hypothetical protein
VLLLLLLLPLLLHGGTKRGRDTHMTHPGSLLLLRLGCCSCEGLLDALPSLLLCLLSHALVQGTPTLAALTEVLACALIKAY